MPVITERDRQSASPKTRIAPARSTLVETITRQELSATVREAVDLALPEATVHSESHPDHLAVLGRLLGFRAAPIARCRLLELHCGAGQSLLPLAAVLPEARLIGWDSAKSQVDFARRLVGELPYENVEVLGGPLEEAVASLAEHGPFDFIICHGLFSYVDRDNQDELLALCRQTLEPRGMACVSYHTEPGWGAARVLREVARRVTRARPEPQGRADDFRKTADRFARDLSSAGTTYARHLIEEVAHLKERSDEFLLREFLNVRCKPLFLRDFLELAAGHGLHYLADARLGTWASAQHEKVQAQLDAWSEDPVEREQYLDLLRNRRFRRTILVREEAAGVSPAMRPDTLAELRASTLVVPAAGRVDVDSMQPVSLWPIGGGSPIQISEPPLKAVLAALTEAWPRSLSIEPLLELALLRLHRSGARPYASNAEAWAPLLVQAFAAGIIDLHTWEPALVTSAGERPVASPWARAAAARGLPLHNHRHRAVSLEPIDRLILPSLDGLNTRASILDRLQTLVERGALTFNKSFTKVDELRSYLEHDLLEPALTRLAMSGLLIA